jgi:hypothetical protein
MTYNSTVSFVQAFHVEIGLAIGFLVLIMLVARPQR